MEDQVEPDVVKRRFQRLLEEIKESSKDNRKEGIGKVEEVLVEERNTHEDGMVTGRLSNNILVHFKGDESLIGQIVRVKITEEKGFYYMGEQVNG